MKMLAGRSSAIWIVVAMQLFGAWLQAADDIIIADFEGPTYGEWLTEGEAFGKGPASGALPGQMHVGGFKGKGLANSFLQGDRTTGTLTSPEFKVERHYIRMLVGGGGWEKKTCVNLLVDGKVVRTVAGPNTVSGGSEELELTGWDVADLAGKMARIQIVDQEQGGWGHINVDEIVLSDLKPPMVQRDVKHETVAGKKWLYFPIKTGGPKRHVTLELNGDKQPSLEMELADGDPDWWAPLDISGYRGQKIAITVDKLAQDSHAFEQLRQSDDFTSDKELYHERLRPQIHFSPRRGWTNDPNGMVFYEGKFHLFFQHNPYGWAWGNMHWGHAASGDLVHWKEEVEALYPDQFGPMFSGSAVVDWKNTSGFGKDGAPPLVLFYTAAGNPTVQCLAYSTDQGKTFVKFDGNPILGQITGGNRDPKVIFHEPSKQWVMVLYVERHDLEDPNTKKPPLHTIQFFTSPDLKKWTYTSQIGGFFECPDLFPLPVDGDLNQMKWVLTAASSEYIVGSFDGQTFKPETGKLVGHRGRGFYAAQTFSDLPNSRRVQIGWLQAESPGMAFNQAMSLPLELALSKTFEGLRLRWQPVNELKQLRTKTHNFSATKLTPNAANPCKDVSGELLEINLDFKPQAECMVKLIVRGVTIEYDVKRQDVIVNGHRTFAPFRDGHERLTIFTDRTAFEIFASDGLTYVPFPVIPKPDDLGISVSVEGGDVEFTQLEVHELGSIWTPKTAKPDDLSIKN